MKRLALVAGALLCALALPRSAFAEGDQASSSSKRSELERPTIVTDVRFGALVRSNDGYFSQADTFGYPVSRTAVGVEGDVGVELFPRFTLGVSAAYFGSGATRRYAKLMLKSESLQLFAKYAALRWTADDGSARVSLDVAFGAGRYWIRETYSDASLFSNTFVADGASMGGSGGVDLSAEISVLRFVVGYAYHYAPASVANEIGGVASAGGHVVDFGIGARF